MGVRLLNHHRFQPWKASLCTGFHEIIVDGKESLKSVLVMRLLHHLYKVSTDRLSVNYRKEYTSFSYMTEFILQWVYVRHVSFFFFPLKMKTHLLQF